MNKFLAFSSCMLISSFAYSANWIDRSGKEVPDSENMKSSKDFIAQLILTNNENELLSRWQTPSESVSITTSETVERDSPISAFIVFGGCRVDPKGNCNLVATFKIFQPDGKVYANLPEMEVWQNKPVPPNRAIQLSVAYLKTVIEKGEQLGKYKIESVVTDKNSGQSVTLESTFNAIEKK